MVNSGMISKWIIKGIDGYVFGEDKKLYRLPYTNKCRSYGIREIKKQYPNRYKIGDVWWSERQLKDKLIVDENPVVLFESLNMPF